MKTVFFGTPDWAVPSLLALLRSPHAPSLVVTQPSRRRGRREAPSPSPVCEAARRAGCEALEIESVRRVSVLERLGAERADAFVVVAFGRILPGALLEIPGRGCVNLHFSLLPRWRGAAPVQWAIACGDRETGATTMRIVPELDAGPIWLQEPLAIAEEEHAPALGARLAVVGADLLLRTLDGIEAGRLTPRPQDASAATHARLLVAEDGWIDWERPAETIALRVRGFDPWPGQSAVGIRGRLHVLDARAAAGATAKAAPGSVLGAEGDSCLIACGAGTVLVAALVRPEGRRTMTGAEAIRGRHLVTGERLGPSPAVTS